MEGEVRAPGLGVLLGFVAVLSFLPWPGIQAAQDLSPKGADAEISLRRSVHTRTFQGRDVEGEERLIGRGDTLWRILVEEKGLPEQKFKSYIVIIRGLNPQLRNIDVLRIGDTVFIPLRPEETLETRAPAVAAPAERMAAGRGVTTEYRVKAGEHLFQILREQLRLGDERSLAQYYALVKDLNPERKDWDRLLEGDRIRLPTVGRPSESLARAPKPAPSASAGTPTAPPLDSKASAPMQAPSKSQLEAERKTLAEVTPALPPPTDARQALEAPAQTSMALFASVVETLGSEMQQSGEEVVALQNHILRFDKSKYPVVYSPALGQRVVIDPDDKIPASLREQLGDPNVRTPVLSMDNGVSLQDAVSQLLARLGYQSLPADRPVIIHEGGIAYEAKGDWIALGPEESNKTQEVIVISLTDNPGEVPGYLKAQLAKRGLHFREVMWPPENRRAAREPSPEPPHQSIPVKSWPRAKEEIIDAMLFSFGVPFGVAETFTIHLRDGLRVDARTDRVFEVGGKRTALFFHPGDPEVRKALGEQKGFRIEAVNLAALTSRELIAKFLRLLGEDQTAYREHRFPAAQDSGRDRLTVKAWGFHLSSRPMFVTDRQIPPALQRFFFEKGLEIVYFQ